MTLQNKLQNLKTSLCQVTNKTYHFYAPSTVKPPYLIWSENGEVSSANADGKKIEQGIYGFADYFTKTEFDSKVDEIQEALDNTENCSWTLNSVQYGDPTNGDDNLIHYTWEWRIW